MSADPHAEFKQKDYEDITKKLQQSIEISITLAIGDHNFPDTEIRSALLEPEKPTILPSSTRPRLSLFDLLNDDAPPRDNDDKASISACPQETMSEENLGGTSSSPGSAMAVSESEDYSHEPPGVSITSEDCDSLWSAMDVESSKSSESDADVCAEHKDIRGGKRTRSLGSSESFPSNASEDDMDLEDDLSPEDDVDPYSSDLQAAKTKNMAETGKSKAARASLALRQRFRSGEFEVSTRRLKEWKAEIHVDDPDAEFDPKNICHVRHSGCGRFFRVKEPYDLTRWRSHLKACKIGLKKKSANTQSLLGMGWFSSKKPEKRIKVTNKTPDSPDDSPINFEKPCPGLTKANNEKIAVYLSRTAAGSGGGTNIHSIAQKLFKTLFRHLSSKQKEEVFDEQQHGHTWKNDHQRLKVYATACHRTVQLPSPTAPTPPCSECNKVLHSKAFKNAISKKEPKPENMVYVTMRNRSPVLGKLYARVVGLKELIETPVRTAGFCVNIH